MLLFLVRHGASTGFDERRWQSPDSPLSDDGKKQSKALIKRSRFRKVDVVLASKWMRAKETGEIVAKALKKPLELFDGIHEREQNPKIYGAKWSSKINKNYYKDASGHPGDLDYKYEDLGESYRDVAKRAIKFKRHLVRKHTDQSLIVISHDIFIRCFVTICILGEKFKDDSFYKVFRSIRLSVTGISLLEYDEKRKMWKVWYLNDFSHFKRIKRKTVSKN